MVSSLGRVKSLERFRTGKNGGLIKVEEKILSLKDERGYLKCCLCLNGKKKQYFVHRLVAEAFITNAENKPFIDHINCVRYDNRPENLQWVTQKENMNNPITIIKNRDANIGEKNPMYGKCGALNHRSKPILQLTPNGELVNKWESANMAAKKLGFNQPSITTCCQGKHKHIKGFVWGYVEEYEKIPFKVFDLEMYRKKVG